MEFSPEEINWQLKDILNRQHRLDERADIKSKIVKILGVLPGGSLAGLYDPEAESNLVNKFQEYEAHDPRQEKKSYLQNALINAIITNGNTDIFTSFVNSFTFYHIDLLRRIKENPNFTTDTFRELTDQYSYSIARSDLASKGLIQSNPIGEHKSEPYQGQYIKKIFITAEGNAFLRFILE